MRGKIAPSPPGDKFGLHTVFSVKLHISPTVHLRSRKAIARKGLPWRLQHSFWSPHGGIGEFKTLY